MIAKAKEIINAAVEQKATDIYILPRESGSYQICFRKSIGSFFNQSLSKEQAQAIIGHFKFVSGMNVGERRRGQLGACLYKLGMGESQRLRLSSVGDFEGRESLVIRLLYEKGQGLEFWFPEERFLVQSLKIGRGLYLFSGPVGSGKTSLMYALAREKYKNGQVITIEDPVEIIEASFLQLQRHDEIGSTYKDLIKVALRHMPDLVIIGEIRDEHTARAVIQASLTGFTVFSTVHARSIPGVFARLLELGVKEAEFENAVRGIIYQRFISGKGVIDLAQENFARHQPEKWNQKMDQLVADGYLTSTQAETEKVTYLQAGQADSAHE